MDISRYRLTGILDLSDKENISVVDCSYNQLIKITLSPRVKNVSSYINQRAKLLIPGRIDCLDCSHNQLSELILPPGIKSLNCSYNQLSELILPPGIKSLNCSYNQLSELILPPGMIGVNCSYNHLIKIIASSGIENIFCSGNQLSQLILPSKFTHRITVDKWPFEDRSTRISMLDSSYADLVREYYISHPELRIIDSLTIRQQFMLLRRQQKWLYHYWRPNGPKSLKLMRESMQTLCKQYND